MFWHIVKTSNGDNFEKKINYYPVEQADGTVQVRRQGKFSLECHFKHEKSDQIWKITYNIRKRKDENGIYKYTSIFNIQAPDIMVPRRQHKLDDVMKVVKNCCFHDRKNSTGGISFSTFKVRLAEVTNKEFSDYLSKEFANRIKEELTQKS